MESSNGASGINLEYDLRLIPAEQVESIEIMKGAASYLIWFRCCSGVINIIKKAGKKSRGTAYMNIGTQTTADRTNIVPETTTKGFLLEI
jgi:vitamin B12 transporter